MEAKDIKILGITVTYNNEAIIPYVMPYYERIGIDKLIVYDNGSTDRTVELLSKYPFVEIRSYETPYYSEERVLDIKTNAWRPYKGQYHWCISTYFDEVFYSKDDFRSVLYEKMCEGKTYFLKTGLNIISRKFPPINNGKLAHENVGRGAIWASDDGVLGIYGNKVQLFNMNAADVVYHEFGCHNCQINGNAASFEDGINFFHLKFLDFDFLINQSQLYDQRMSPEEGITCYDYFRKNLEAVYTQLENRSIDVQTYMNSCMKDLCPPQVVFVISENLPSAQIKIIDNFKNANLKTKWAQFGLLFHGDKTASDAEYQTVASYAYKNHVFVRFSMGNTDPTDAIAAYDYLFNDKNFIITNPWVCVCHHEFTALPEVLQLIENTLIDCNSANMDACDILNLERYDSFIIKEKRPVTLGCYMIVKNEESTIKKCLDSIAPLCDKIVIADTGSSDKTVDIISQYPNVQVYSFEWVDDFSAARNFAMSKIDTDYSFTVDADEEFTPELITFVRNAKKVGFSGLTCLDIWLLNYNRTETPGYYLGGRQIVKNNSQNKWKYRVHEKLYCDESRTQAIPKSNGLILHKHNGGSESKSNYNKYAEFYYDEINGNKHFSDENGAHFFYYMFLTLKNHDMFTALRFLPETFDTKRHFIDNEDVRAHLWRDGYINFENFAVYEAIKNDSNPKFIADILMGLTRDDAKYAAMRFLYDNDHMEYLTYDNLIEYAIICYNNGLLRTFGDVSKRTVELYGDYGPQSHNVRFFETYIKPIMESRPLVIDCTMSREHLPSLIYYFSEMFDEIIIVSNDEIEGKYSTSSVKKPSFAKMMPNLRTKYYVVNGQNLVNASMALKEYENLMYNKPLTFIQEH